MNDGVLDRAIKPVWTSPDSVLVDRFYIYRNKIWKKKIRLATAQWNIVYGIAAVSFGLGSQAASDLFEKVRNKDGAIRSWTHSPITEDGLSEDKRNHDVFI